MHQFNAFVSIAERPASLRSLCINIQLLAVSNSVILHSPNSPPWGHNVSHYVAPILICSCT